MVTMVRGSVRLALVISAALLAAACGGGSEAPTADDLDGVTFTSASVEGHDLVEGSTITLAFDEGRMVVQAGCNTMTGEFEVADGVLAWTGQPAMTQMGCEQPLADQDQWVSELFTAGLTASLSDDELTLESDGVTITMTEA